MPRLKYLFALVSTCQIAILESTNRRWHHSRRQSSQGTIGATRGQISHTRQPEQEERWLAAEIATKLTWGQGAFPSAIGNETDARQGRWDVGQWPFATYCAAAAIPVANKAQRKLTGSRLLQNTTLVTQRRSGGLLDDFIRECEHRGRDVEAKSLG
jgi:hypothetical protein